MRVHHIDPRAPESSGLLEAWDRFVDASPAAVAYHARVWPDVIARALGHDVRLLLAESDGSVAGVLPLVRFSSRIFGRFSVSLPFLNYGGIVAEDAQARTALLDAAIDETREAGGAHLELRHVERQCDTLQPRTHKVAMVLDLQDTVDRQWQALDRKVRNQVRKAEKSGVYIFRGSLELVSAFYDVFARNMRDLGTPVYSMRFFEEIVGRMPERTRVLCAWVKDQPVAASIVCRHRETMEVPWASSIREFNPMCPNVLLYWHMLQLAIGEGCRRFDFGRSTPLEGTYDFKKQWGAQPVALTWEYWMANGGAVPDMSPKNPKFARAIELWKQLPVPVTRILGPAIVRNIP